MFHLYPSLENPYGNVRRTMAIKHNNDRSTPPCSGSNRAVGTGNKPFGAIIIDGSVIFPRFGGLPDKRHTMSLGARHEEYS
jgi:hypothetical protein